MLRIHRVLKDHRVLPHDFWESADSELMVDERWAKEHEKEIQFLAVHLPSLEHHVWIASSGTISVESKWIGISKQALLKNADSVNAHLRINNQDCWALNLPLSHVGGLAIHARTYLLKQKIQDTDYQWISLVPTQIFDLVKSQTPPPNALKGAIVGGDKIEEELYQQALRLGWPLLRSFGMSEVGSQLATETSIGSGLKLLSHARLKIEEEKAFIQSECLYTLKAMTDFKTLRSEQAPAGWYPLSDRLKLSGETVEVLGREDLVVKILGVKVDLVSLEAQLKKQLGFEVVLIPRPDERRGVRLKLVSENLVNLEKLNSDLLGFQQISEAEQIDSLPRTSLGKIKRGQLG